MCAASHPSAAHAPATVAVPGVCRRAKPANGLGAATDARDTARSAFAAYCPSGVNSTSSSPTSLRTMNSRLSAPPMFPLSACTARHATPSRDSTRPYTPLIASKCASRLAASAWKEYASFITNSRVRSNPNLGRSSSRNFRPN